MQPDSQCIAAPSATRIRQRATGVVIGAAALGAEIGRARGNWSLRAASRTAVAVAGRRVRGGESLGRAGALQLHLHGPLASSADHSTLGAFATGGPPEEGVNQLTRALSMYLRKAGYPPAARTSLLFAPITTSALKIDRSGSTEISVASGGPSRPGRPFCLVGRRASAPPGCNSGTLAALARIYLCVSVRFNCKGLLRKRISVPRQHSHNSHTIAYTPGYHAKVSSVETLWRLATGRRA